MLFRGYDTNLLRSSLVRIGERKRVFATTIASWLFRWITHKYCKFDTINGESGCVASYTLTVGLLCLDCYGVNVFRTLDFLAFS